MTMPGPAAATPTAATLTPSEIVLLHGADFAPPGRLGEPLLLGEGKVAGRKWMENAYVAALVANVQAGAVTLERTSRKTLFGLLTTHDLVATRTGSVPAWPRPSLEAELLDLLAARPVRVRDLFYAALAEDATNVASHGLLLIKARLAARDLLEVQEKKTLKVFKTATFVVPDATRRLAAATPAAPVRRMLDEYAAAQPELMREVRSALDSAISSRTIDNSPVDVGDFGRD